MNKEDENNLLERMHAVEEGLRELKLVESSSGGINGGVFTYE